MQKLNICGKYTYFREAVVQYSKRCENKELFCLFLVFPITVELQIEKSKAVVLGFRTELWRPPFLNGPSPASFPLFSSFQTITTMCLQQIHVKMSIQYTVLGFEPMTFRRSLLP